MARKGLIQNNILKEKVSQKLCKKAESLKLKRSNTYAENFEKMLERAKMPRNASPCRVRHRCVFSGRPRAWNKSFRISRIVFRDLSVRGLIPGVKKSSW